MCTAGLRAVQMAWWLSGFGRAVAREVSDTLLGPESLEELVTLYIETTTRQQLAGTVMRHWLRLPADRRWNATALAESLGISRQRVYQLKAKYSCLLRRPESLRLLTLFWLASLDTIRIGGGACTLEELGAAVSYTYGWQNLPPNEVLAALLRLQEGIDVDDRLGIVIARSHQCLSCSTAARALDGAFSVDSSTKTVDEVRDLILTSCGLRRSCSTRHLRVSRAFVAALVGRTDGLWLKGGHVYHQEGVRPRNLRVKLVEEVLRSAERPLSLAELSHLIRSACSELENVRDGNVRAWVDRSDRILRWGRQRFVHEDHVKVSRSTLQKAEDWLLGRLRLNRVPFVSVEGAYAALKAECQAAGLDSRMALYACLRKLAHPQLAYPRYPQVYLRSQYLKRVPNHVVLESFVRDAGAEVGYDVVRTYAIDNLMLRRSQFEQSVLRMKNVVRTKLGFMHVDHLRMDRLRLEDLVRVIRRFLEDEEHVSVHKVFSERQVTCSLAGVSSPEVLYSLLRVYASDQLSLSKYPQICLRSADRIHVRDQLADYIRAKRAPCTLHELRHYFVDQLGYSRQTVECVSQDGSVVWMGQRTVVHLDTIEWNNSKQAALEASALVIYRQATAAGRLSLKLPAWLNQTPCLYWVTVLCGPALSWGSYSREAGVSGFWVVVETHMSAFPMPMQ